MSLSISTPDFSFLQFADPLMTCSDNGRPCLPVVYVTDLAFRVRIRVTGADKPLFESYQVSGGLITDCDNPGVINRNYLATWDLITPGDGSDPDIWEGLFTFNDNGLFPLYEVGQCMAMAIFKNSDGSLIGCLDTCLVKSNEMCYSTLLQYRNREDAFDFAYTEPLTGYNRVRLPFYLHSPVNTEEEKSYAKSDGSSALISARMYKDYKVTSDYWPEDWIEKFAIATRHDDVLVSNDYSNLNEAAIIRTESLDINWRTDDMPSFKLAQVKTTVRLSAARSTINNNCQ